VAVDICCAKVLHHSMNTLILHSFALKTSEVYWNVLN